MARGGVNKVILIGNLGGDPEVRYMPNGDAVANVSVATSESWKDKNTGETHERTEWHRVVFFRRVAEVVGQYLHKGSKIYVEGRLRTRKWQGQDGQDRYTTEIIADNMQMLDSRPAGGSVPLGATPAAAPQTGGNPVGSNPVGGQAAGGQSSGGTPPGGGYPGTGGGQPSGGGAPAGGGAPPMDRPDFDDDVPF